MAISLYYLLDYYFTGKNKQKTSAASWRMRRLYFLAETFYNDYSASFVHIYYYKISDSQKSQGGFWMCGMVQSWLCRCLGGCLRLDCSEWRRKGNAEGLFSGQFFICWQYNIFLSCAVFFVFAFPSRQCDHSGDADSIYTADELAKDRGKRQQIQTGGASFFI